MKNKDRQTAFDFCSTSEMKDLLDKYTSQNANTSMNQSKIAASLIKEELYQNLSLPSASATQDYLLLLSTVLACFVSIKEEGVKCNSQLLKRQFDMLATHVRLLSDGKTSLKCKLYLKTIKDLLHGSEL